MKKDKRISIFSKLKKYDAFAGDDGYMELTEWVNGEGFDVDISSKLPERFQLTWGEYDLLKKMVKKLQKS